MREGGIGEWNVRPRGVEKKNKFTLDTERCENIKNLYINKYINYTPVCYINSLKNCHVFSNRLITMKPQVVTSISKTIGRKCLKMD